MSPKSWPATALPTADLSQAIGLFQHRTVEVFEPIAAKFPL
jgi:hypothetical protein